MAGLAGKFAVVTGASRGIGQAIAAALHAEGATVARLARSMAPGFDGRWLDLPVDLTDQQATDRVVGQILTHAVPDIVVNNAGLFALAPLEAQSLTDLDRLYAVNVRARFHIARAFLPGMRDKGSGRHVLIGSVADHRAFPSNAAYAATKFAVRGLHEVLREEFRGTGVLGTLISPGAVDTDAWDSIDPDSRPDLPDRAAMLQPENVAEAVRWVVTLPPMVDIGWMTIGRDQRSTR